MDPLYEPDDGPLTSEQLAYIKEVALARPPKGKLISARSLLDEAVLLRPIRNDEEYDHTVSLMNYLLDTVGDQEDHPLSGLLDLVGGLVADYDAKHFAIE